MTALTMEQTILVSIWMRDITILRSVLKIVKLNAKIQLDANLGLGIQVKLNTEIPSNCL